MDVFKWVMGSVSDGEVRPIPHTSSNDTSIYNSALKPGSSALLLLTLNREYRNESTS